MANGHAVATVPCPASELWRLRECTRPPLDRTDVDGRTTDADLLHDPCESGIRPAVPRYAVPWLVVTYDRLCGMPLGSRDAYVVSLLDGRATVDAILDMATMPEQETMEILVRLLVLEAIELR